MPIRRIKDHKAIRHATPVASKQSKYIELCGDQKAISLLQHEIRSVQIDCCFRFANTKWGHIDNVCSGVIYIDLTIQQPEDCRLTNALTTITLTPVDSNESPTATNSSTTPKPSSAGLEITEFFGPRAIYGKAREASYSTKYLIQPEINASVATIGGMGLEHNKESTDTSRWKFEGWRRGVVCEYSTSRTERGKENLGLTNGAKTETKKSILSAAKYRRILWRLEENQGESQVFRSPTLHTAFAFEHGNKPFFLEVEFEGKLRHRHHRALERLVFPPRRKKANVRAKVDAERWSRGINENLKSLAMGLDETMVEMNNRSQGKGKAYNLRHKEHRLTILENIVIREPEEFEETPTATPGLQNVTHSSPQLSPHTAAKSPPTKKEEITTKTTTTSTSTSPSQTSRDDILAITRQLLNLEQDKVEETKAEMSPNGYITTTKATSKPEQTPTDSLTIKDAGSPLILSIARYFSLYLAAVATWLAYVQKRLNSQYT
jgi:hypothetical protein